MHTTRTAFLTDDWDLMLETDGTLKMCAGEIESVLQNCCNEIRLWLHDAYFRYEDERTINLSWQINTMVQGCLQL